MGLDPDETKKISQNFPSVYELLPSLQYFNSHGEYLFEEQPTISDPNSTVSPYYKDYNFTETKQELKNKSLNAKLVDQADSFHDSDYDNFDVSGGGIQAFNIVGCQTDTFDKLIVPLNRDPFMVTTAGDGTVPIDSAKNISGATLFYALKSSHGTMLTQDGIRQEIENLITGSNISTHGRITSSSSDCHYNSTVVSVHSPVDLNVYDEFGNHLGPNS